MRLLTAGDEWSVSFLHCVSGYRHQAPLVTDACTALGE